MAIVNGSLELGYKNLAWFNANPTLVLKEGQIVYLQQTGTYKIGNGTSTLSALSFLGVSSETQTLQNVTDLGSTTTNSITANGFVKSGGTASQFLKANGSVDSTTYLSTQVVPVGGTTGQILAKVDDTDYNLEWIENYANYTSVLKHTVKASVAVTKGQAVYVSGASGTNMLVSKASNATEATSSKTLGLVAQDLAINGQGFVITEGLLSNLNTNSATIGDPVWLGVDGALIYGLVNKPYAPSHLVFIGIVTRVSATVGEIFVKVQNGFELREIHDVDLITTTPSNNEILTYESSTSLWKNKSVVSALGFTPYNSTNPSAYISGITSGMVTTALGFTPYNSTNPSGYITGITSGNVTTALGFTPYNATNPSGYITSSALTPYAPLSNPTFTTAITTPIVNGVSGLLSFGSTDRVSVGNYATPSAQRIFTVGQDTGWLSMGSCVNLTSQIGIFFGSTSFNFGDASLRGANGATVLNCPSANGTIQIQTGGSSRFVLNGVANSGATEGFTLTKSNNTNQTASTSIAGFNYNGGTRQWATGAITTQSENVWGATTYSFVGPSTITNAYGNVFNAPVAGTNCTITNNVAALFNGAIQVPNGTVTNTAIQIGNTPNLGFYSSSANKIDFVTSGAVRMSINADGTVVMGTAATNVIGNTYLDYGTNATGIRFTATTLTLSTGTGSPGTGINYMRMFQTGNILIQNGGTFTDAGFRLDVNGTARFQGNVSLTQTVTTETVTSNKTVTIVINGTTYKLLAV